MTLSKPSAADFTGDLFFLSFVLYWMGLVQRLGEVALDHTIK